MVISDIPVTPAADVFIWGFVLVIAVVLAIVAIDAFKEFNKDPKSTNDKRLL